MFSYKTLVYTFAVLLLGACIYWRLSHKVLAEDGGKKPAPPPPPAAEAPSMPGDNIPLAELEDGIILQAGDIKIPLKAVEKVEKGILARAKAQQPNFMPSRDDLVRLRKNMAIALLDNELVDKYVKDNKLEASKEDLAKEMDHIKACIQQESNMTFSQFLATQGMDEEEFNRMVGYTFALRQKLFSQLKEEDVNAEYNRSKDMLPARRVSEILIMYKGSQHPPGATVMPTRTKEEAQTLAAETLKKLKNGTDFAELVKSASDGPTKAYSGDISFFRRQGDMPEAFAEAAYKLEKVGDISDVVETAYGFVILKLTALRTPETLKNDFVKEEMIREPRAKLMQQITAEWHAKAKINEKLLPAAPKPDAPSK